MAELKPMQRRKVSPRISERAGDWLQYHFKSPNAGAEFILDAMPSLFFLVTRDLKEIGFTKGEISLMIEACNGLTLSPGLWGHLLIETIVDGVRRAALDEKWEVDITELIEKKLNNLNAPQRCILELYCVGFWQGDHWKEGIDIYMDDILPD